MKGSQMLVIRLTRVGRFLLALFLLTALFMLMQAHGALAADEQVATDSSLRVVQTLNVVVSVFLPILVALVTKTTTSAAVKAWLLALLNVLAAFITTYINDPDTFDLYGAVLTAVVSFATSVAVYYGLWRPTGVAPAANRAITG